MKCDLNRSLTFYIFSQAPQAPRGEVTDSPLVWTTSVNRKITFFEREDGSRMSGKFLGVGLGRGGVGTSSLPEVGIFELFWRIHTNVPPHTTRCTPDDGDVGRGGEWGGIGCSSGGAVVRVGGR